MEMYKIMEHIVQFAIGIDDETITDRITQNAEKEVIRQLTNDIRKVIFEVDYRGNITYRPSNFVAQRIDEFLENNRDDILEITGKYLAEKLVKTKRGKEILDKYETKSSL